MWPWAYAIDALAFTVAACGGPRSNCPPLPALAAGNRRRGPLHRPRHRGGPGGRRCGPGAGLHRSSPVLLLSFAHSTIHGHGGWPCPGRCFFRRVAARPVRVGFGGLACTRPSGIGSVVGRADSGWIRGGSRRQGVVALVTAGRGVVGPGPWPAAGTGHLALAGRAVHGPRAGRPTWSGAVLPAVDPGRRYARRTDSRGACRASSSPSWPAVPRPR